LKELGGTWTEIAKQMPGRTSKQCQNRWMIHLDPSLVKTGFTAEEDEKLRQLKGLGGTWYEIVKQMPGRIYKQCRNLLYLKSVTSRNGDVEETLS